MCVTFVSVLIDGIRKPVCSSLVCLVDVPYPCMYMLDALALTVTVGLGEATALGGTHINRSDKVKV